MSVVTSAIFCLADEVDHVLFDSYKQRHLIALPRTTSGLNFQDRRAKFRHRQTERRVYFCACPA